MFEMVPGSEFGVTARGSRLELVNITGNYTGFPTFLV